MTAIDTVVIGAGHAGLAVSRLLTEAGRDHVVLDRGRIGERWRSERWDSLHLLTPNWMNRLPGCPYSGTEPEGFLSAAGLVDHLERYAVSFAAPVVDGTAVEEVSVASNGLRVATDQGTWAARHVVIVTGPHGTPHMPQGLDDTPTLSSNRYRNPAQLPPGGVLVVGASASGMQIADELREAGREVLLAVGRHTRMPRRYRGMDIFWWLEATGRLSRTIDEVADPAEARRELSLQLVGRNDPGLPTQDLDLASLQARGVRLAGRLDAVTGATAQFRNDLAASMAAADATMHRFLDSVDRYVEDAGLTQRVWPAVRPRTVVVPSTRSTLDLRRDGIGTVLLAAGYRPKHPWLRLPVTGPDGSIRQYRGITPAPGLYVVGQRFQHRRDSGFITGARHDALTVVGHLLTGAIPATGHPRSERRAA